MNTKIKLAWAVVVAAGLAGGAAQAQQAYPNKAVKFIVTYPPGGSSDVMARIIGKQLTEYWGQQVLVDTRPGADGAIGMEYAARQPADGYTFLLGNFGPVVAKPLLANTADGYAPRPGQRPLTKFEDRGLKLGHGVWDLVFRRV